MLGRITAIHTRCGGARFCCHGKRHELGIGREQVVDVAHRRVPCASSEWTEEFVEAHVDDAAGVAELKQSPLRGGERKIHKVRLG